MFPGGVWEGSMGKRCVCGVCVCGHFTLGNRKDIWPMSSFCILFAFSVKSNQNEVWCVYRPLPSVRKNLLWVFACSSTSHLHALMIDPRRSFMPRSLDSIVVGNGEVFNGLRENYMSERLVKTIREQWHKARERRISERRDASTVWT